MLGDFSQLPATPAQHGDGAMNPPLTFVRAETAAAQQTVTQTSPAVGRAAGAALGGLCVPDALADPLRLPLRHGRHNSHRQLADRRRRVGADVQQVDRHAAGKPRFQRHHRVPLAAERAVQHGDAHVVARLDGGVQGRPARPLAQRMTHCADRLVAIHAPDGHARRLQPPLFGTDPLQLRVQAQTRNGLGVRTHAEIAVGGGHPQTPADSFPVWLS